MLVSGTMLGPYRILSAIGAGGMGEVYRAHDDRLERDVAIKVLSRHMVADEDAVRRFEQEARAAGMLNHPNILAIYDIGQSGEVRYIVSELLEGESLRARMRQGPVPPRKAIDYAAQIARGLAAAHERGIVHRDLKPENLFLTRDGHVKILDFGLAKLARKHIPGVEADQEITVHGTPTEPGRVMGTVGYMSPEQIRGGGGDHRSDIFAFGIILYEMLAGRRAFSGDSPIETLNAILKDDPPDFFELNVRVPAALDRIVRHCLEKLPEERFQSARDLAFDLGSLSGLTSGAVSLRSYRRVDWRRAGRYAALAALLAAALLAAYFAGRRRGTGPPLSFRRVTYRTGSIYNARFSPDGQTIFYGARWNGAPVTIFSVRTDSPESRDLGFGVADILSVSRDGQLAISLRRHPIGYLRESGTLAQVAIAGGAPRELADDVEAADWTPDGKSLAVVRTINGRSRLELPAGNARFESKGWIATPRVSPSGDAVAFIEHPFPNDDRGSVVLLDLKSGKARELTSESQSVEGLAWTPDGRELWFAAERAPTARTLNAVDLRGRERIVATSAGALWLHDIAPDGHALVSRENVRAGILARLANEPKERDLSWLDYSVVRDLSADGKTIVFSESGEAGGALFGIYVRRTDGSPAIRLGDGTSEALSPDGKWVLSIARNHEPPQIMMMPTGAGQPRQITHDRIVHFNARWFPDGRHILFRGNLPPARSRMWMQAIDGSAPRPISPEGVLGTQVTPDGTRLLGRAEDRKFYFYSIAGGTPQPVPALGSGDVPVRFSPDGRYLYVSSFGKIPALLQRVDLGTGERTPWHEAVPPDPAGLINVGPIFVTPDGGTMVYSYTRLLSDLYIVEQARR
jgi:Tol biopolymer transport system component